MQMDATGEKRCNFKNDISQCTICKVYSKAILYVCDSGHVLCTKCQQNNGRQDCGDMMKHTHKYRSSHAKKQINIIVSTESCTVKNEGLTNGQNGNDVTKECIDSGRHKTTITENINYKEELQKDKPKLMLKFKNKDYNDSISSITSSNSPLSKQHRDKTFIISRSKSSTRPIECPICAIIISVNSVMLHFYFDHSKIPRLNCTRKVPAHTLIKVTEFDHITKCFSVLLLKKCAKMKNTANYAKDEELCQSNNSSFLLMGALINSSKCLNVSEGFGKNDKINKGEENNNADSRLSNNDTDYILLWVCRLDDGEAIYDLTLTREDRKLGYSHTGEAIHVRDEQDPATMYKNAYGLMLKLKAGNRLIDPNGQLNVFVNIH